MIVAAISCLLGVSIASAGPVTDSPTMLSGSWVSGNPQQIKFQELPRVPCEHAVVSDVRSSGGVNQHNYLAFHDGRFWVMWSDGPGIEDRVGQRVKFATSGDGLHWSAPEYLTPEPPHSGAGSPYYNTRSVKGMRYIARGFWQRGGELLALVTLDEAGEFFGPRLELRAFRFDKSLAGWIDAGLVCKDAINNFPPVRLRTGAWMMSRRTHDYREKGVQFLAGGLKSLDDWQSFPVLESASVLAAEEPEWWAIPDGRLVAVFRDNRRGGFLYRAISADDGRTWTRPVRTNFPDATSKVCGLRLTDGRYVLVSNPNPAGRDPLAISISEDGLVFDRMLYLVGGRQVDYPHVIERDGCLIVAFSGGKQAVEILKVRIADLDSRSLGQWRSK